jgi:hypothetical protein
MLGDKVFSEKQICAELQSPTLVTIYQQSVIIYVSTTTHPTINFNSVHNIWQSPTFNTTVQVCTLYLSHSPLVHLLAACCRGAHLLEPLAPLLPAIQATFSCQMLTSQKFVSAAKMLRTCAYTYTHRFSRGLLYLNTA